MGAQPTGRGRDLAAALVAIAACTGREPLADTHAPLVTSQIAFAVSPTTDLGGTPGAVAIADFDGDGRPDIAAAIGAGGVSVALERDGGFSTPRVTTVGNASALVPGDFDRDGKVDVAVIADGGVALVLGHGDGSFAAPRTFAAGTAPAALVAADFDGDGKLDVATLDWAGSVDVLLGNGDGTLQSTRPYAAIPRGTRLFAGDIDGDGKLDLLAVAQGGRFTPLFGKGDGTFRVGPRGEIASYVRAVAAGDFDGDGKLDIVAARQDSDDGFIFVELGNGDGTFRSAGYMTRWRMMPKELTVADLDGDGKLDVLAAIDSGRILATILGKGDGSLGATTFFALPGPLSAVGDVDGDGKPDVLSVVGGGVAVLAGNADGTLHAPRAFDFDGYGMHLATGDFDGDGVPDVAVTYDEDAAEGIRVLLGDGHGGLRTGTYDQVHGFHRQVGPDGLPAGSKISAGWFNVNSVIAAADLNGDGMDDIVCGEAAATMLATGNGSFRVTFHRSSLGGRAIAHGDFDGDGKVDLALCSPGSTSITVLPGKGDGTYGDPRRVAVEGPIDAFGAADLDGDGRSDLVVSKGAGLELLFGTRDGAFEPAQRPACPAAPGVIAAADLNGDGRLDLVVAHASDARSTVLLNAGGRTFHAAGDIDASGRLMVLDLDGDGIADVVAKSGGLTVLRGKGDGTFDGARPLPIGAAELVFADLDRDGLPELVATRGSSSFLVVYRNVSR